MMWQIRFVRCIRLEEISKSKKTKAQKQTELQQREQTFGSISTTIHSGAYKFKKKKKLHTVQVPDGMIKTTVFP